jgi:hypothetical protein
VPSSPDDAADLTVVVDDGRGTSTTYHLVCGPAGGDHPDPELACRALHQHGERALPPVPPDQQCTQVYGGPATARITGTWRGRPVDSSLSRRNGCEIARWDALSGLLPGGDL